MNVLDAQSRLKVHGFDPGPLDADYGPKTNGALEAFQKARGIEFDPGPKTLSALAATPAIPSNGVMLDSRAEKSLVGVHPDLVRVVRRAAQISGVDFTVTEGPRSVERQRQLVASGASQTMNSRHIPGGKGSVKVAHAVDLAAKVDGTIRWDWPLYDRLAAAMKSAAKELGVPLEWGGDWRSFKDGPHFQLPFGSYPA